MQLILSIKIVTLLYVWNFSPLFGADQGKINPIGHNTLDKKISKKSNCKRACTFCRSRKMKCDDNNPCQKCKSRLLTCIRPSRNRVIFYNESLNFVPNQTFLQKNSSRALPAYVSPKHQASLSLPQTLIDQGVKVFCLDDPSVISTHTYAQIPEGYDHISVSTELITEPPPANQPFAPPPINNLVSVETLIMIDEDNSSKEYVPSNLETPEYSNQQNVGHPHDLEHQAAQPSNIQRFLELSQTTAPVIPGCSTHWHYDKAWNGWQLEGMDGDDYDIGCDRHKPPYRYIVPYQS